MALPMGDVAAVHVVTMLRGPPFELELREPALLGETQ
jgi:hypothetical protein